MVESTVLVGGEGASMTMSGVMTYEQMLALLSRGEIDIEHFDENSLKTLSELYEEIRIGEATLVYNKKTGRVERHARSVKIAIEAHGWELREVGRIYLRTHTPIIHSTPKWYALSETMLPHEIGQPFLTAERCLLQEPGIPPSQYVTVPTLIGPPEKHHRDYDAFKGVLCYDYLNPSMGKPDVHESKVYDGILSKVPVWNTRLIMPQPQWKAGRKLKDGNVLLLLKWFHSLFPATEAADTIPA